MTKTSARLPEMAKNNICITTPFQSPSQLYTQNCHAESGLLAGHLPLTLTVEYSQTWRRDYRSSHAPDDNIAAFRHATGSRIHRVKICTTYSLLSKVATVMQESFPALTHLERTWDLDGLPGIFPVLPEGFLGGSAPRLRDLHLGGISFPELPTLFLSARNLVTLQLENIFHHSYISPEAMIAGLAVLVRLRTLSIEFFLGSPPPDEGRR
ncbi:hypothetical protein EDB92DRAFT_197873 [Lactarius akahatsu]|uniref:Uncharacterized protein n=1 Tax=Lactarius akahatsu TaxID=416441 RepID=A0AAD4LKI9_9AGAM|nr:hypothetical protein EDB92DRAFT_197873 [Lactarius akahatsu]